MKTSAYLVERFSNDKYFLLGLTQVLAVFQVPVQLFAYSLLLDLSPWILKKKNVETLSSPLLQSLKH